MSGFTVIRKESWSDFLSEDLTRYSAVSHAGRSAFIFRGQASTAWQLESTLTRFCRMNGDAAIDETNAFLLNCFERHAKTVTDIAAFSGHSATLDQLEWKLLARHHGIPSTILDWTSSPFVAAFFAFADLIHKDPNNSPERAAIWAFDRSIFEKDATEAKELGDAIRVIDAIDAIRINRRALEQRSVFLDMPSGARMEDLVSDTHLWKYEFPVTGRIDVLAQLGEMGINDASLFRDLDGASEAAIADYFDWRRW